MTYIKIDKFSSAEIEIEKSDLGISIINLKDSSDLDSLLSTEFTQHIEKGKTVLVHCFAGGSRSASFVVAYLM